MPERKRKQLLARQVASLATDLGRVWNNNGHPITTGIGLVLTEVFFTANPWVTAQYVAGRTGSISVDTARRRLEEMVDHGTVEVMEIDSKKVYRAGEKAAEATVSATEAALIAC